MSMLSTFAILFETDSKQAAKETDELANALDDVEKSAESATGAADDTTKAYDKNTVSVSALTKSMVGLIGSLIAVDAIADKMLNAAANIDTLGKLSQTIGLNIVELDAWGEAVIRNGGSAEALRGTVESLQTSLQDIEITGGGEIINTLAMIGIQATKANGEIKSAFEILPEIAEAFEGMSTEKSFAFGKRLGLDQGTILTLQQSRHEVDKLVERQKMLGGVTEEGYENAAKFNDQWADTKRVFNSLWISTNNSLLPIFEMIGKGLESVGLWIRENKDLVEGFFLFIAIAATVAAVALMVMYAPFILIGAAVAALSVAFSVLYEDIKSWVNGGKSAIGELLGTFENLKNEIKSWVEGGKSAIDELLGAFENFKNKIKGIFDGIGKIWDTVTAIFKNDVKYIADFLGFGDDEKSNATAAQNTVAAQNTISSYSNTNLNHGGSLSNQTTQQNNITVGGAKIDARGMSSSQAKSAFTSGMSESIEMAMGQLADGVER